MATKRRAFITGLSGTKLLDEERAFLREAQPFGLILFKRNVEDKAQVTELVAEALSELAPEALVLVDQEGGRVQRFGPPHWPAYPPGAVFGKIYDQDPKKGIAAAWLGARLMAADLLPMGINTDCVPLADVPVFGSDQVIGDRAYGATPEKVAAIAAAVAEGIIGGGMMPVLKHIPGHGRANADSHQKLPVVSADRQTLMASDFAAFRPLKKLPLGMSAHVVFTAFDPVLPATISPVMISEVIRGLIGFEGLLMGDDISMGALSGTIAERARASLKAGCDLVLHCNGKLDEMRQVAAEAPELKGEAAQRAQRALNTRRQPGKLDIEAARSEFAAMIDGYWA